MIKYKQIQFIKKGNIIFSLDNCTMAEALEKGKEFNPINDFLIIISCICP